MITKINTLTLDAFTTLQNNLIGMSKTFVVLGTAVIFDAQRYEADIIYRELAQGYEGNIMQQKPTSDDKKYFLRNKQ